MSGAFFTMTEPAKISALLDGMRGADATWQAPLFRAALAGDIAVLMVAPGGSVPLRLLDPMRQQIPTVVLLGGDGRVTCGPEGFPQSRRLIRWAGSMLLHGAGGEPEHYETAVTAARLTRRVLIAETTSAGLPAWVALARELAPRTPALVIQPRPGDVHPRPEPAGKDALHG